MNTILLCITGITLHCVILKVKTFLKWVILFHNIFFILFFYFNQINSAECIYFRIINWTVKTFKTR